MSAGFIDISSLVFSYIGAAIILYGGAVTVIRTLKQEVRTPASSNNHDVRRYFTNKIVFGLDFLVASDILKTIVAPSQQEVFFLGTTVGIRIAMGYFLSKEAREFESR